MENNILKQEDIGTDQWQEKMENTSFSPPQQKRIVEFTRVNLSKLKPNVNIWEDVVPSMKSFLSESCSPHEKADFLRHAIDAREPAESLENVHLLINDLGIKEYEEPLLRRYRLRARGQETKHIPFGPPRASLGIARVTPGHGPGMKGIDFAAEKFDSPLDKLHGQEMKGTENFFTTKEGLEDSKKPENTAHMDFLAAAFQGLSLVRKNQHAEAIPHFQEGLQCATKLNEGSIRPENLAATHFGLAVALEKTGKDRDAMRHFHQAFDLPGAEEEKQKYLYSAHDEAISLQEQSRDAEAVPVFQKVALLAKKLGTEHEYGITAEHLARMHTSFATSLIRTGDGENALEHLRKSFDTPDYDKNDPEHWSSTGFTLAELEYDRGKFPDADKTLQKIITHSSNAYSINEARIKLGFTRVAAGSFKAAIEPLLQAVDSHELSGGQWLHAMENLGIAHSKIGNRAEAHKKYETMIKSNLLQGEDLKNIQESALKESQMIEINKKKNQASSRGR